MIKSKKIKFIIKESFSSKQTFAEVFVEIILSENRKDFKLCEKVWTQKQLSDIIKLPTVKS